jgi:hypothetical protein
MPWSSADRPCQPCSVSHHPSAPLENRGAVLKLWGRGGTLETSIPSSQPLAYAKCYNNKAGERCVTSLAAIECGVDEKNGCLDVGGSVLGHDAAPAALRRNRRSVLKLGGKDAVHLRLGCEAVWREGLGHGVWAAAVAVEAAVL